MPFGGFESFDACVLHMKDKEGYTEEVAKKVCGRMQADAEMSAGEPKEYTGKVPVEMVIGQKSISFIDEPNGDTLFLDVTLMAEGTWTDSYSKQPNFYSADEVAKMKFEKMTVKMHHDVFNQMPLTNEIGIVENIQFHPNPARWKGNVRIFPTQNGKDVALLLKRKQFRAISPEMYRIAVHDKLNKRIIAKDLSFMGAATVREGACSLCTFNEGVENTTNDGTPPNSGGTAGNGGAPVELNNEQRAKISALESQITELQKKNSNEFIAQHEALVKENALLKEQVVQLTKQLADSDFQARVADLERQYKALSSQPVIHSHITARSEGRTVQLDSDPEFYSVSVRDME